jgi:hypothetical protein
MLNNSIKPNDEIRTAATAKGFADISIVPQTVQDRGGALGTGGWLVLSVKRQADDAWELLGRRRTEAELLGVIQKQASKN